MNEVSVDQWEFGEFRLDARRKILRYRDKTLDIPLKEIEVLCMLVRNRGELVTKNDLFDEIWGDSFVGESNLSRHIYLLRKTLKSFGAEDGLIDNVPRRGYRFTGEVRVVEPDKIFVEKHTRTRTLIEIQDRDKVPLKYRSRIVAFAALLVLLASSSVFLGYQYFGQQGPNQIRSLAVLPFKVEGAGGDSPHAGTGLADILTTRLSNIKNIRIRPASSTFGFEDQDAMNAGERLQVDAVLDGSIYYLNERVRVTAKLIRVSDMSVVWAGEFEKLKKDESQLQKDIALQIVPALAVNLSGGERDALVKEYTRNADAFDLYLKGRYEWNKRSLPGMTEAQRLFRNAIAADPGFSLAYVGLADTLLTQQPSQHEASVLISKALELDPNLAEAHASRGFYFMFLEWRWVDAEAAFKRSLELNPNYATAHHWYATLLAIKGDTEAAKSEMHRALELNPISHNFLADLGQLYYFSGEYTTAEKYCLKALEIYPDFTFGHEYLHYIYLKTGEFEKAVSEIERADAINRAFGRDASARSEGPTEWEIAFRESGINSYLEHRYPGMPYQPHAYYLYAKKHAFLGENEKALEYLEKSIDGRQFLAAFLKADPVFEALHSEPRYQKMLQKMRLV
jgi:DNA-binding winged helix-turn-helix (wHTH) protein/tetratricopeptide (TPR) repeat protein